MSLNSRLQFNPCAACPRSAGQLRRGRARISVRSFPPPPRFYGFDDIFKYIIVLHYGLLNLSPSGGVRFAPGRLGRARIFRWARISRELFRTRGGRPRLRPACVRGDFAGAISRRFRVDISRARRRRSTARAHLARGRAGGATQRAPQTSPPSPPATTMAAMRVSMPTAAKSRYAASPSSPPPLRAREGEREGE